MRYFGQRSVFLSSVALAVSLAGTGVAQDLRNAQPPAEFPPASFTENQYVDSRGCVFVRAGIGGAVDWVPRVTRDRAQLCGFQPSNVGSTTAAVATPDVPNPLDTPVAGLPPRDDTPLASDAEPAPQPQVAAAPEPAPAPTPAPVPQVAAAPAPAPAPAPTVAPVVRPVSAPAPTPAPVSTPTPAPQTQPLFTAPVATAAPSPQIITPTPEVAPAPRTITFAEACEGKFGIQPNLRSARTGEPIDCGPAPAPVVAAVPTSAMAPAPATDQNIQRMTRAQACADAAATGRQYISVRTGLPVDCSDITAPASGGGALAQIRAGLQAPAQTYRNPLDQAPGATSLFTDRPITASRSPVPYSNPLDRAPGSTFVPGLNTQVASCDLDGWTFGTSAQLRCGPQAQSPSDSNSAISPSVTYARTQTQQPQPIARLFGQQPVPYSNPTVATILPRVPDGYERVWGDGRINLQRGIRPHAQVQTPHSFDTNAQTYATQPTQAAPQPAAQTSVRAAAPVQPRAEQISGERYVQVATFASRSQAQDAAQRLRGQGLPMRIGVYTQNGQELRIVLAGPFANTSQLQNALGTARAAGYAGAFTRQ